MKFSSAFFVSFLQIFFFYEINCHFSGHNSRLPHFMSQNPIIYNDYFRGKMANIKNHKHLSGPKIRPKTRNNLYSPFTLFKKRSGQNHHNHQEKYDQSLTENFPKEPFIVKMWNKLFSDYDGDKRDWKLTNYGDGVEVDDNGFKIPDAYDSSKNEGGKKINDKDSISKFHRYQLFHQ